VPFLRVIRDKRGYETTYLMHWYREGNRQHSRILYVFRSPGGVRVGRDPLEPEILQRLEAEHPDIAFDWKVVRDNQQVVDITPEPRRRRPRADEGEIAAPPAVLQVEAPLPPPARPSIPSTIEGDTPDAQIVFLAQVYTQVRDRIQQRSLEAARQEALLTLAERLNPATWSDADQITTGLQQAAEALDRLAHVFAKRRRRTRRKSKASAAAEGNEAAASETGDSGPEAAFEPDMPDSAETEESSSH
jgi:hypothetical protein